MRLMDSSWLSPMVSAVLPQLCETAPSRTLLAGYVSVLPTVEASGVGHEDSSVG